MKNGAISRPFLVVVIVAIVAIAGNVFFLLRDVGSPATPQPKQAPQTLQKFKASGFSATAEWTFLVTNAGMDLGIWTKYGLDPEWITIPGRRILAADIKDQVVSGTVKIGLGNPIEVLLARSNGVPVKIVAGYIGGVVVRLFVKANDESMHDMKDLNGKKIGVDVSNGAQYRQVFYLNNKFAINAEPIPLGNLTNMVVALKLGRVDAILTAEGAPLRLVDSGELRIILHLNDILPRPFTSVVVYATDDLVQDNPDLVRSFVKATLETVKYLKENPSYAAESYMKRTNAPRDLADKVLYEYPWTPSGRGSGQDLVAAVNNYWQLTKDIGAVPANINLKIEDAVDLRFLP